MRHKVQKKNTETMIITWFNSDSLFWVVLAFRIVVVLFTIVGIVLGNVVIIMVGLKLGNLGSPL